MERLTTTSNKGGAAFTFDLDITCDKTEIKKILKLAEKLKKYEDLEEQCVQESAWGLQMVREKWKEFLEDIQHFYEYRELEGQGKLVKLPCAVGDTVYTIYSDEDGSFIEEPKVEEVSTHRVWIDSMYFDYDDFGKTVFLTREKAEAALKEL